MSQRFTIDGSESLEQGLEELCQKVSEEIRRAVPPRKLQAVVLGGGYGRGEGGVLRTESGDQPYNDIEFYVFIRGNRHWSCRQYGESLLKVAEDLSRRSNLHVEFKIDSLERLRAARITMF